MPSKQRQQKDMQTINEIVERLTEDVTIIERQREIRGADLSRISDAFKLLEAGPPSPTAGKREQRYHKFLLKTQQLCGDQIVALCAASYGKSQLSSQSEGVLIELPVKLQEEKESLECTILGSIIETIHRDLASKEADIAYTLSQSAHYSLGAINTLAGDVYELLLDDLIRILSSECVHGQILLTDPYHTDTAPFVTISVSHDLRNRLIQHRPKLM